MSEKTDIRLFELLKKEVSATLRNNYPGNDEEISQWKGQEIKYFQDDLMEKVQGRISEKWFYTHLKSANDTIPRVDILNLLTRYCGYEDWIEFRAKNRKKVLSPLKWRYFIILFSGVLILSWFAFNSRYFAYEIEIIDALTLEPIKNDRLEVWWIKDNESPILYHGIKDGKLNLNSETKKIKLVIKAPYYFTDTLDRNIPYTSWSEKISLQPDEYSRMIRFFSQSEVGQWERRREKLKEIFAYNATIFQVSNKGEGMEIYNKDEFIDKLSFPLNRLKNIEVLDSRISKGKIVYLRFKTERDELE